MTNDYAVASRDELWSAGALVESRLTYGRARRDGDEIVASDERDDELIARCEARFAELREVIESLAPLRQRGVVEVVREDGELHESSTLTIAFGAASIVTTPEHAHADAAALRELLLTMPAISVDALDLPIVWRGGSAAVLFHEAIGHAAEHAHEAVEWPAWLRVDCPLAMRRASFRDVPLPRMTTLVTSQHDAPFDLPSSRIEVHLVEGGFYEPLTEEVTLRIAVADVVEGDVVRRARPFELRASRREFASAVIGASGEPVRYPGVICSREGQELVVGSYAPVVVTKGGRASSPPTPVVSPPPPRGGAGSPPSFYKKRGAVVRRENNVLLRINECGEAIDDGNVFVVRPTRGERETIDATAVEETANRLAKLNPERLIVSEGIAHHECDGRTWSEHSRRIHLALVHDRMRVLIDHADFDQLDDIARIAAALKRVKRERRETVRVAPAVTAALLPSLKIETEQTHGVDGRGEPIENRAEPYLFRPTYRQRPIPMRFNIAAIPFGVIDEKAPVAIAIVNGSQLLSIDGDDVFLTPLRLDRIIAIGEPLRWYPYAAGSFGAWMML